MSSYVRNGRGNNGERLHSATGQQLPVDHIAVWHSTTAAVNTWLTTRPTLRLRSSLLCVYVRACVLARATHNPLPWTVSAPAL